MLWESVSGMANKADMKVEKGLLLTEPLSLLKESKRLISYAY